MSMTKFAGDSHCGQQQPAVSNNDSAITVPVSNNLRNVATVLPFQESRYKDGGAHWYRSSAVLLHYHRYVTIIILKANHLSLIHI